MKVHVVVEAFDRISEVHVFVREDTAKAFLMEIVGADDDAELALNVAAWEELGFCHELHTVEVLPSEQHVLGDLVWFYIQLRLVALRGNLLYWLFIRRMRLEHWLKRARHQREYDDGFFAAMDEE